MTPGFLEARASLKRLLQGAVAGALVTMILGFIWADGCETGSAAPQ